MKLGETLLAQSDELAEHSVEKGKLTRLFLTPELRAASELVLRWMREAGMTARIDPIGNVVGRLEGARAGLAGADPRLASRYGAQRRQI